MLHEINKKALQQNRKVGRVKRGVDQSNQCVDFILSTVAKKRSSKSVRSFLFFLFVPPPYLPTK